MNQTRKNFIFKNETFVCEQCMFENDLAKGFIRNHCSNCLYSKHVDLDVPGDRQSECGGLMKPEAILWNGNKGWMIVHKCIICAKVIKNKVCEGDNMELVANISSKGYETN